MGSLKRIALFIGYILMVLTVIFHINIGYMWMLVPFIIYAATAGWDLLRAIGAVIYSFASKGKYKTQEILKENADIQKTSRQKSRQTLEDCIKKLLS